ncbi:MAG: DUF1858 domain-containing protein [candidate division Zixibacteria bacterium]|nr:DUF1858 domain-containing protein [candidate division Zixibacteria bacterium]
MTLSITPETKIGVLLDTYPQLEEVLVKLAPPFAKLRNPILRKTVARVTSLRQAALVGGVDLAELINTLRKAVGEESTTSSGIEEKPLSGDRPAWFDANRITATLDARPLIKEGEQPLGVVMRRLNEIPEDKIFELITPFIPAPLIDKARKKGFDVWYLEEDKDLFKSYFYFPKSKE